MPRAMLLVSDDAAGRGGVERGMIEVAHAMLELGWRVIVLVPGRGAMWQMCVGAGLHTQLLSLYRRPRLWRIRRYFAPDVWLRDLVAGLRARRLMRREQVSVIYCAAKDSEYILQWAGFARRANLPIIWSCHDTNPAALRYCRQLSGKLEQVVAVSEHVRTVLREAGLASGDKVTVLHNGLDLDSWDAELAAHPRSLREELGIAEDQPVIGLVARMDPIKGHVTFLGAALLVLQKRPDALFLLIGVTRPISRFSRFATYYRKIVTLSRSPALRGHVLLTGWKSRMAPVMASLDLLVQPSTRETFGRTLIEAMAARKPVIASRVGGMPEVVSEGETGLLVPAGNAAALAAAILSLLEDPPRMQQMGEAGRRRVEQHFALEKRTHAVASICSAAAAGSASVSPSPRLEAPL